MAKSLEKSTKNSFKKNFSELFEPKKPVKNSKKGSNPKCSNSENSSLDVIGYFTLNLEIKMKKKKI